MVLGYWLEVRSYWGRGASRRDCCLFAVPLGAEVFPARRVLVVFIVVPGIEALAVGLHEPVPAGGGADGFAQDAGEHGAAAVAPAAFGLQALAPTVLRGLAHDGAAEGGQLAAEAAGERGALPLVPGIRAVGEHAGGLDGRGEGGGVRGHGV